MAYSSILLCIVLAFGTCTCQYANGDWMAMLNKGGLAGLTGMNGYNPAMLSKTVNAIAAQYGGGPINLAQYMGAYGAGQGKGVAMGNGYAQGETGAGMNGYNPAMLSQTVNAIAAQYGGGPINLAQYMGAYGAGQGKGVAMGNGYAQGETGAEY